MRRTRIVATIGPASEDAATLAALAEAGADIFRLNYSHGEPAEKTEIYTRIRALEQTCGRPFAILADLPGPKLRLGTFPGVVDLREGAQVELVCGLEGVASKPTTTIPVAYGGLPGELTEGDPVLIADGLVRLQVESIAGDSVHCIVIDGGPVSARKGVNVPGTVIDLPAVGPRDLAALEHALASGADYVAVSYVRTAADIAPARSAIRAVGQHVPIIAKIEHPAALDNLESILDAADAVMVARGDLGVEIPLELVPLAQQDIIDAGLARGQPVIVATQMLESMTLNPRPTRAEVSDVSTAIRHGATGVMLSGETASGAHPVAAVQTMARIAKATEEGLAAHEGRPDATARFRSTRAVAHAGVELAQQAAAAHIIVATEHGNAPRLVAGYRPGTQVTAVTDRQRAARRTCLLPGVDSVIVPEQERGSSTMRNALETLVSEGRIAPGSRVVAISGSPLAMRGATSTVRMYRVGPDGRVEGDE